MPDQRITELSQISTIDNANDPILVVDVSDQSMDPTGTNKKISVNQILGAGAPIVTSTGTAAAPAISFAGDPNTGIYSPLADTLCLVVNGTEALRCTSNNQIAIARTGTAATPSVVQSSDTNTGFYFPASDTFGFVTGGVERVRVDSAGRVGIGTASPASFNSGATPSLAIVGASAGIGIGNLNIWSNDTGGGANLGGNIALGGDDGVTSTRTYAEIRGRKENATSGDYASYLSFGTRANGGSITERMRIDSDGKVGIGKTPSLGLLDVNADAYFNTVRVGLGGGAVASNTAVGNGAMAATATGTGNVAVGNGCLASLTSGSENVGVGRNAISTVTTGSYNTGIGRAALNLVNSGSNNTAIGWESLKANTASDNTAVGFSALTANTSGTSNTAVGRSAGAAITTGSNNAAFGNSALATCSTASANAAFGREALKLNTASDNTAFGCEALTNNSSGTDNVAVGRSALAANVTASNNTAIGRSALAVNTASNNTAVGTLALQANTTGNVNVAVGTSALSSNTTGSGNVAVGTSALSTNGTSSWCTAVGRSALALSTAADNTALGWQAGNVLTTGASNTIIGSDADASGATGTGQIVIGKGVTGTANNRITVGITTNIAELDLDGADTSWAASSDERLKQDIATYTAGLDVITALRPVTFRWKAKRDVPTELTNYYADSDEPVHGDASKTYHGFIAQEVKAVLDANPSVPNGQHLWEQRDDGVQTLAPADLVPILVNAIKQLTARVQALENA